MRGREAALKEVANSKLPRLLATYKSFRCTDVAIGDSVLSYTVQSRKGSPRRRGPAKILDVGETGMTITFLGQKFEAARYCARRRLDGANAREEGWQTVVADGG